MRRYCADTSSLVAAWDERYPHDFFPNFWEKMATLIKSGRIFAPDEVRTELSKRSKELVEWLDQFDGFFIATDEPIVLSVTDILATYPKLVMVQKVAFAADPFVISCAKINRATVLTEEGFGSSGKPKIPFVCRDLHVECCSLLDMIKEEKWVMGRS